MHPTSISKLSAAKRFLIPAMVGLLSYQSSLQAASSLPTGGTFTAGSGNISASGNILTITQNSLKGIIDWKTFSSGKGSTVSFKNGSGATLNLVTGGTPSTLLGQLLATGNIYLLNPEGVLIGKGATIKTGGDFVASTLALPASQFLSNAPLLFSGSSQATVVNLGSITSNGGNIYLIGRSVQNGGSLSSPNGTTGLASGAQVLVSDSSNGQKVSVQAPGGDVTNSGFINAAQVELKSNGGNIYALAGSNGGYINATGTANIDGHVWLIATNGTTNVSGAITAANNYGQGGAIETSGSQVKAGGAQIKTGRGGNWLLDPDDLTIDSTLAATIDSTLNGGTNVTEQTGNGNTGNGDIFVNSPIAWTTGANLTLSAFRNVALNANISNTGAGSLTVRADNTSTGTGTISGSGVIDWSSSTGNVALLYNPSSYAIPTDYSANFGSVNGAWAAPANGSVSSQYTAYMLVNTAADLQNLGANGSGTYALGDDIDLSSIPNWTPLTPSPGFGGIFDGMGHTISNLTITTNLNAGLFGAVSGQVRNLNLTDVVINATSGNSGAGAIAADLSGTIANSSASGIIHADPMSNNIGGLVGSLELVGGTIQSSHADVTIDAGSNNNSVNAGGLVGFAFPTSVINNSYATGSVTAGTSAYIGGLVGQSAATITNSHASGNVSDGGGGYGYVGGLAGASSGSITGSYATGDVTGAVDTYAGGLVGNNTGPISSSHASGSVSGGADAYGIGGLAGYSNASISGSHATGPVQATDPTAQYIGGLVGQADVGGTITSSYATGNVTGDEHAGGLTGSNGDQIMGSYATGSVTGSAYTYIPDVLGGLSGVSGGPISNSYATGAVTITNNIYSIAGGLVGNSSSTISGSWATGAVSAPGSNNLVGGLAGQSSGAISTSYATGMVSAGDSSNIGGLVGQTQSGGTILSSYATGAVTGGQSSVGGLVGSSGDTITGSYATGAVTAGSSSYVGGLVGVNLAAITTSFATGAVYGDTMSDAGGLVGQNQVGGAISVSYAIGDVSANGLFSYVGGLVGDNFDALTDTYARGAVNGTDYSASAGGLVGFLEGPGSITRSYSSGAVQNNGLSSAGFLGYNGGGTVSSSYWDSTASGFTTRSTGGGSSTVVTPLTTAQLKVGGFGNLTGFNATNTVWAAPSGAYPYFGTLQGPLLVIQGTAFNGSSGLGTAGVGVLWNGSVIANTITQSNGYYAVQVPTNMTTGGVLTYLTSGGVANAFSDGTSVQHFGGMNLQVGAIYIVNGAISNLSSLTNSLAAVIGGFTGSNFLYTVSSGILNPTSGVNLLIASYPSFTFDQPLTTTGNILFETLESATIANASPITAGSGDSIKIAVGLADPNGSFTNNAGANALNVPGGGEWLVYSHNPVNDTTGGLTPAFIQYNAALLSAPGYSGDGLLYTIAPVITPSVIGTVIKTYDGTNSAALTAGNFATSGVINGDTVTITTPSTGTYGSVNAGTGIAVTAPGVAISSASNGSIPVYGYQLSGSPATGNIGTINPATLTYTANPVSSTYGGTNPSFSGTVSGFVNSETLATATTGSAAFTSSATTASNVGSYAVNGSGLTANNGNYIFAQADANASAFTINPATLTYIANAGSRTYGASNPTFTGTVTGFVNSDTLASATTGSALFTSSATTASNVGTYAINGSGLTANNGNYLFTQGETNSSALTINPATLAYLANPVTRTYGGSNPTFGGTVTGFLNSDTLASATTGSTLFTSSATAASNVGTYSINGSGLTANNGNYLFTQAPANASALTINPATLTYLANPVARTYGGRNPAFSGTVSGFVNSDTLASATAGSALFTSSATATSNVGTYAINGSGLTANHGNYLFTQAAANASALTINPATLTYTANPVTLTPGANATFSGTVSGFVNSDTLTSATTGSALFTSPAAASSPSGSYGIYGSGLTANYGNYIFTQAASNANALTLTAAVVPTPTPTPTPTPAPTVLTFTIGGTTWLQNSKPTFAASYTGPPINGLDISSILAGLTFTVTPSLSGPGTYTVTASGTPPSGYVLNIAPATLTIVANAPATLPTQAPPIIPVVPEVLPNSTVSAATSLLQPLNSVGLFQVDVTGSGSSLGASFIGFGTGQQAPLAQSGFFSTDKKDTYSAGAKP